MDALFLLSPGARSRFLHDAARATGCAYVCVWSYVPFPSNCLICSDRWLHDDHGSLGRLFDMYRASFCSVESGCVPGLAYKEALPFVELPEPDLIALASTQVQRQFYQEAGIKKAVFIGCKNGEVELGMSSMTQFNMQTIQQLLNDDLIAFPADQSRPSSSSSSLRSMSVGSPEYSSIIVPPHQMTMQAYIRHQNVQLPTPASDDAAIMRAMLAVISSPSSSSPRHANPSPRAFGPYNAALGRSPVELRQRAGGHKMIKAGISILRSISLMSRGEAGRSLMQEARAPSTTQLHHMISERRRREKLNESFHALRMLLPPGSKKDKASVLFNTRDYLKALKTQVSELQERNRLLEQQCPPEARTNDAGGSDGSSERVQVEIVRAPESTSQVLRAALRVTVRAECDMAGLLLRVLEFLKEMGGVDLVSADASASSSLATLNLSLQIEAGEWDEQSFKEAVAEVVSGVLTARPETANP